jgi:hypothetical protein
MQNEHSSRDWAINYLPSNPMRFFHYPLDSDGPVSSPVYAGGPQKASRVRLWYAFSFKASFYVVAHDCISNE